MKTWFITGASTGFGRKLAETVLRHGDNAVVTARSVAALGGLVERHPHQVLPLALDLTVPAGIEPALSSALERFGAIDVLVNNAGYGLLATLEETDDARLERNLETNLIGPLRLIRAAIPLLRQQGHGHIITISAIAAFANELGFSVYGAAKAGLEAASEALAGELAPFGIAVTVVVPGPLRTDFIGRSLETVPRLPIYQATVGKFAAFLSAIDGKQPGDPVKAAEAIYGIAGLPKPPFRLVLGGCAYDKFEKKLQVLEAELQAWKAVGLPTDYPRG
jgi:NAD(P)-dependent dehydrogenase (short-subunit alcohol dehydrogenase family)